MLKALTRQIPVIFLASILAGAGMAHAAENPVFSSGFMDAVDSAMKAEGHEERIRQLHAALDEGTDSEVLYVSAIIIPREVLSVARQDGVCEQDITNLSYELQFVVDVGADVYLADHAETFRASLKKMVACIHTAYRDGIPVR